jgi:hypothetical protein
MENQISEAARMWEERIKEQRNSGLSQKEWCVQNNLSVNTMQSWIKKLSLQLTESKAVGQFVKVVPAKGKVAKDTISARKPEATPVIRYREVSIRFPDGGDMSVVCDLLNEIMGQ